MVSARSWRISPRSTSADDFVTKARCGPTVPNGSSEKLAADGNDEEEQPGGKYIQPLGARTPPSVHRGRCVSDLPSSRSQPCGYDEKWVSGSKINRALARHRRSRQSTKTTRFAKFLPLSVPAYSVAFVSLAPRLREGKSRWTTVNGGILHTPRFRAHFSRSSPFRERNHDR